MWLFLKDESALLKGKTKMFNCDLVSEKFSDQELVFFYRLFHLVVSLLLLVVSEKSRGRKTVVALEFASSGSSTCK